MSDLPVEDQFDSWCRANGEHVSDNDGVLVEPAPELEPEPRMMMTLEVERMAREFREMAEDSALAGKNPRDVLAECIALVAQDAWMSDADFDTDAFIEATGCRERIALGLDGYMAQGGKMHLSPRVFVVYEEDLASDG